MVRSDYAVTSAWPPGAASRRPMLHTAGSRRSRLRSVGLVTFTPTRRRWTTWI